MLAFRERVFLINNAGVDGYEARIDTTRKQLGSSVEFRLGLYMLLLNTTLQ